VPQRLEEGLLLWGYRQLRHVLLLEVPATFLLLPLTLSTGQVLPVKDILGILICFMGCSLKGLPDGVQCLV
jgi:hypothetical protein